MGKIWSLFDYLGSDSEPVKTKYTVPHDRVNLYRPHNDYVGGFHDFDKEYVEQSKNQNTSRTTSKPTYVYKYDSYVKNSDYFQESLGNRSVNIPSNNNRFHEFEKNNLDHSVETTTTADKILFSHDSIKCTFQNNNETFEKFKRDLMSNPRHPVPAIKVHAFCNISLPQYKYIAVDGHRRLYLYKELYKKGYRLKVLIRVVSKLPYTADHYETVRVRYPYRGRNPRPRQFRTSSIEKDLY